MCLNEKQMWGWFALKPITFVFAYLFLLLNEKQMWGWFVLKPIMFEFAYFFSLNEEQMGWFVLKPIMFVFAYFFFLLDKCKGQGIGRKKRIFVDSCSALSVESAHGQT